MSVRHRCTCDTCTHNPQDNTRMVIVYEDHEYCSEHSQQDEIMQWFKELTDDSVSVHPSSFT